MKRLVPAVLGGYLLYALVGRVAEKAGAIECGCDPGCWCKRPALSTFRWAFPYGHTGCGLDKPPEDATSLRTG